MPTVSESSRNRAAVAFIAIFTALAGGYAWLQWNIDHTYVEGGYYATPDAAPNKCWRGVTRAPSPVWSTLRLFIPDGGSGLALSESCYYDPPECEGADGGVFVSVADTGVVAASCELTDAGSIVCPDATVPAPPVLVDICANEPQLLPGGVEYTPADEEIVPYVPGNPVFRAWVAEHPDAPWRCACGVTVRPDDGPCEKLTLSDAGLPVWMPATSADMVLDKDQWRGGCARKPCSSWGERTAPAVCCADEFEGLECGPGKCGNVKLCAFGLECVDRKCVVLPGPDAGEPADAELPALEVLP